MTSTARMRSVVVDCDPGIDDALALLALAELARRAEIRVELITTVRGNVSAMRGLANAAYILDHSALTGTLLLPGADIGLSPSPPPTGGPRLHGPDGLGGLGPRDEPHASQADGAEAADALAQRMLEGATILSLAPLTNVALALERCPSSARLSEIVIMGGAFGAPSGNVTPFAEFNFASDPVAAQAVLSSSLDATVVPLDVTQRVAFSAEDVAMVSLRASNPLVGRLLQRNLALHRQELGLDHCYVHDAIALILMADSELMTAEHGHSSVVTNGERAGQVSLDDGTGRTTVALGIDAEGAKQMLVELWASTPSGETLL